MSELAIALLGAAVPVTLAAVYKLVIVGASLPRRVVRLEEIATLQLDTLDAQTQGIIAIAEAVSGQECDGNITDALSRLRGNKVETSRYVNAHVTGGAR